MFGRFHLYRRLCAGVAVAAVTATLGASAVRAQPAKTEINVGVIKIAGLSDVYAAQKLGYFADQGLDAKLTFATNGQVLLSALESGSLDITLAIPGTAMQARDRGGYRLVLVSQNEVAHVKGPDQGALVVRYSSPITSVKDLAGKKIGYGQIDNQQWAGIHDVLEKAGVDPKSTQELEVPFPQMPAALDRGLVDAVGALEPFVSAMLNAKQGRVIAWNYSDSVPAQPVGAFWATEDWAAKNRATARKFAAAMHASITYLNAHPDVRKKMVEEFTGMQPEQVANLIPDVWSDRVVRSDWEKTMRMMVQNGLISANLKFTDLVPPSAMDPGK